MKNIPQHPENSSDGWSEEKLNQALHLRQIWQDSLKHENNHIKALLQDGWWPYFLFITKYLGNSKRGYELESSVFITDKPVLVPPSQITTTRPTTPWIQISFYYVPEISDDELENSEFEILPADFNKRQEAYINKVLNEFSDEIGLPVNIVYE